MFFSVRPTAYKVSIIVLSTKRSVVVNGSLAGNINDKKRAASYAITMCYVLCPLYMLSQFSFTANRSYPRRKTSVVTEEMTKFGLRTVWWS